MTKTNRTRKGKTMVAKKYQTSELQDALAEKLGKMELAPGRTFAGSWWGRGETAERFYFGDSATICKNGKPIRGIRVWLQFDNPATLDGASLHAVAKKEWHKNALVEWHAPTVMAAIELVDPEEAARLRAELAAAEENDEPVGDMVAGEESE